MKTLKTAAPGDIRNPRESRPRPALAAAAAIALAALGGCARNGADAATRGESSNPGQAVTVGVVEAGRKNLERELTVSSELVPFQEIDVYAKESGYVRQLLVDYGSRVKAGQLMAMLEIPELEAQLRQDDAMIRNASDRVVRADHELSRYEAQHHVLHLEAERLSGVARAKPGLVAQQEVDDAVGKDLAAESGVESAKSNLEAVRSDLLSAQARHEHDQVLLDYSRITAPFGGVVTQRFANLGALMQAGTSSSTQAMPLVRLSQDNIFRLVIPVAESYVRFIHIGDGVDVSVPSLNRRFQGRITRFSEDVREETRTMHTEVDVPNPSLVLVAGMYAEARIKLEREANALAVPLQAVSREGEASNVYVVGADHRIEIRNVQPGLQTDADLEVLGGVKEGELVVVGDRSGLKAGQEVRPQKVELLEQKREQTQ